MTWFGILLVLYMVLNLMLTPFEAAIRAATPTTLTGVMLQMFMYVLLITGIVMVGTGRA